MELLGVLSSSSAAASTLLQRSQPVAAVTNFRKAADQARLGADMCGWLLYDSQIGPTQPGHRRFLLLRSATPPGDGRTISEGTADRQRPGFHEGERLWLSWAMAMQDPGLLPGAQRHRHGT